jgi:hypothetical protein
LNLFRAVLVGVTALLWLLGGSGCRRDYPSLPGAGDGDGGVTALDLAAPDAAVCEGLACRVNLSCPGGTRTTLSGQVFAPNGTLPLYNATVFIPTRPLEPFPVGVSCDRCDGRVSGAPLALAQTGPDGRFTLTDVPSGADVPLVVQLGRWRREVRVPLIEECASNAIADTNLTRLPRNSSEGNLPLMALVTGAADAFGCLLVKLGIDPAEVTSPTASRPGRIHSYRATDRPGIDLPVPSPSAVALYSSLPNLLRYDVVLLPCEGGAFDKSKVEGVALDQDPRALLTQYLDAGGRVFATHLSYSWYTYPGSPYNRVAAPTNGLGQWPVGQPDDYANFIPTRLAVTFPKGADFASWLRFAGAQSPPERLLIEENRHDLTGVDPTLATAWSTYDFSPVGSGPGVMLATFNSPLDPPRDDLGAPAYCGRTVFSDFHVTAGAVQSPTLPFPITCKQTAFSDQELALVFMLFDLSSCVQSDREVPIP